MNILGIDDLRHKTKILHRDISIANIIIDYSGPHGVPTGRLIDWEMSKRMEELNSVITQRDKSVRPL